MEIEISSSSNKRLQIHKNPGSLLSALKECGRSRNLKWGKELHSQAIQCQLLSKTFIANAVINMYAKCRSMADAQKLFNTMSRQDVVSWNCLIQGYADNGDCKLALDLFDRMQDSGKCFPDSRTYVAALTACASLVSYSSRNSLDSIRWLEKGKDLHSRSVSSRCYDGFVANRLINMYAKCGDLLQARDVFNKLAKRDAVSWSAMLQAYNDNGEYHSALELFDEMECNVPDSRTYLAALTACAALAGRKRDGKFNRWLAKAEEIYSMAVQNRCCDLFVENMMINMFARSGNVSKARRIFDRMVKRDVVSWNSLIQGYVDSGRSDSALEVFERFDGDGGCFPDSRTFLAALTACATLAEKDLVNKTKWLDRAKAIHSRAVTQVGCNSYVENMLVSLYAQCGSMNEAREVFDQMHRRDVVSWNALLRGYVENGDSDLALELFGKMKMTEVSPDGRTYLAALTACAALAEKELAKPRPSRLLFSQILIKAKEIHSQASAARFCDIFVETALVDVYAKCGSMIDARSVFDGMIQRDVFSWNCLIQGYVESGDNELALELLAKMDDSRNAATYIAGFLACGNLLAVESGGKLHEEARRRNLGDEVASCVVHFYGKCGCMDAAKKVFDHEVRVKDIRAWNNLLYGYSQQGDAVAVFDLFRKMTDQRVFPNEVTFTHVLTACSHAGLTDRGREYFDAMKRFGIKPDLIHYTCIVDLLARGNLMEEAMSFLRGMPCEADAVTWTAVLGACEKWNNVEVGRIAYEALLKLDEKDSVAYVFMANIYKGAGLKDMYAEVIASKNRRLLSRTWWTDSDGKVHAFP